MKSHVQVFLPATSLCLDRVMRMLSLTLLVLTEVLPAMTLALPLSGSGPLVPCMSILAVSTPKLSVAS